MRKLFKHPWLVVAIIMAITVFFAMQLPKVERDNNYTNFLPEDASSRIISNHLNETYGEEIFILVGLERPYGTIFDGEFLTTIRNFETVVESFEFVKDFNSIMRAPYISADNETITVSDLAGDNFTGTSAEITELKNRIASWDLYWGSIISDDLRATQILVSLDVSETESGTPEVTATLNKIHAAAREMFAGIAEVYITGKPVIAASLSESMKTDVVVLIPLVVVVMVFALTLSFRKALFVSLPLLTVIISTIWAVGAMPLFGVKLSTLSSVLPIILIAVGSAYGIHLVSHYRDEISRPGITITEHSELVFNLARTLLKPVFLAALTTFAGFISFCFTALQPIREFGYFISFGVIAAFVVAMLLIPAFLLILGPRAVRQRKQKKPHAGIKNRKIDFDNILAGALSANAGKKSLVLVITAFIVAVSLYGLSKLIVDSAMVEQFREETDISRSDRFIREHFGGSTQLTVSVEADSTEVILSPQVLSAVDGLSVYLSERIPETGKVVSFTDMVKRVNQLFNIGESPEGLRPVTNFADDSGAFGFGDFEPDSGEFGPFTIESIPAAETVQEENNRTELSQYSAEDIISLLDAAAGKHANTNGKEIVREFERLVNYSGYAYYEIPAIPERYGKTTLEELQGIISNYLVLLSGSDNDYSNDPLEPTAVKIMVQIRSQWQRDAQKVINAINGYTAANFPENVRVVIGGGAILESEITNFVLDSQIISIVISILIVFIIIAASNRSCAAGIIAALPLTISILCNFAVMSFFGITLNLGTALIASAVVGIGIDYTIHFIEFFKREYRLGGDFLKRTFASTGKAIIINAVSVGAGFAVLAFSQFRIIAQFGLLVALNMVITAAISLTVIPVLLTTIKPKFIYGETNAPR